MFSEFRGVCAWGVGGGVDTPPENPLVFLQSSQMSHQGGGLWAFWIRQMSVCVRVCACVRGWLGDVLC